jgi:hypothetical protein
MIPFVVDPAIIGFIRILSAVMISISIALTIYKLSRDAVEAL